MATTTHVPDGAPRRSADSSVHRSIAFASICPKCSHQQAQGGFSRAALGRLLNAGHPIEAYCVSCDDFWSISSQERYALAARLAQREH